MAIANNFPSSSDNYATIQTGKIEVFGNKADRPGYLLCDGSSIYNTNYPELTPKLKQPTFFYVPTSGRIKALWFLNDKFIGEEYTNSQYKYYYSTDCITWTHFYTATSANDRFRSAAYGGSTYVFGGNDCVYRSTDLANLTKVSIGDYGYVNWLCYGNNRFVGVTSDEHPIYSTNNGSTWSVVGAGFVYQYSYLTYSSTKKLFYSIWKPTGNDEIRSSSDGATWTTVLSIDATLWDLCAYGNYIWVATSNGLGYINGTTITTVTTPLSTASTSYTILACEKGLFVKGNQAPGICYSTSSTPSSISWQTVTVEGDKTLQPTAFGNGIVTATEASSSSDTGTYRLKDTSLYRAQLPNLNDDTNQLYGYIKT